MALPGFPEFVELPTCAVCGKPVDDLLVFESFVSLGRTFVARCHGAEERAEVSLADMEAAWRTGGGILRFGVAFGRPIGQAVAAFAPPPRELPP